MLGNKRFIHNIQLKNFLSYGESAEEVELKSLNVLIGPNSSGKSNLIEALGLLQAAPSDLTSPIRLGGGINEWLWKGKKSPIAEINAALDFPDGPVDLRYNLQFTEVAQRTEIVDESVENVEHTGGPNESDVYFFYRYRKGNPILNVHASFDEQVGSEALRRERRLRREDLIPDQSVLSQRKDPDQYPEITYLGNQFSKMKLYREWNLGRNTEPRKPQSVDMPGDFLEENAKNLVLVLNDLEFRGLKPVILKRLKEFYSGIEDISTRVHGGTVQIYLKEKNLRELIPATRLSDGTLRYMCLLAILCHPSPPPVVCIEEPELGLHADVLSVVAELLIEASQKTQLIVTTHSDILVSALTDVPESVLVCERDMDGTYLRRLDKMDLSEWLEKYQLGELWRMGEIGGTL